jgi:hypothetical protein
MGKFYSEIIMEDQQNVIHNNFVKDTFALILEILFLFSLFCGIVILLNYFQLIHVEKSFSFLSFLPRQNVQNNTSHIVASQTVLATQDINKYIHQTISPAYLPTFVVEKQVITQDNIFSYTGSINHQIYFGAHITYDMQTKKIKSILLILEPFKTEKDILTEESANNLVKQYFTPLVGKTTWVCTNTATQTICNSIQPDKDGKIGFSFESIPGQKTFTLYTCFISNTSSATSCLYRTQANKFM